ncbi:hypothetical protein SAY87_032119 [Trapa incisa]|uniref:Uncharacterized protein n=1 Tax=Trapa incisa TaxID=236973 RepID=A0AAN7QLJ7_9MYRT|nr:hypothetical protein SAY87_032119 [Trapa incisa]
MDVDEHVIIFIFSKASEGVKSSKCPRIRPDSSRFFAATTKDKHHPTGTISKDQGHWLDQKEMDLNAEEAPVRPLSSKAVHTLEFRIINERN